MKLRKRDLEIRKQWKEHMMPNHVCGMILIPCKDSTNWWLYKFDRWKNNEN